MIGQSDALHAAEPEALSVHLQDGENLRDLAERYLQDPDLWPIILQVNGLDSVTELQPGATLKIPVTQVTRANQAIVEALAAIQEATQQGARLFAADAIAAAIGLHEQAVAERLVAAWDHAAELAERSKQVAAEALRVTVANRDVPAEALLSDRQGWVEGQQPQELIWTERVRNAILIEEEKIRTLSRSTAQITFRDDSRLRLNANSHAVVQRMRVDPLTRREDAKVSLIEGDFYALLGGRSDRKRFEVEIPNVETDIESTDFWVSNDRRGAKFTNYDQGVMTIAAAGESVTLGQNEGALVRPGRPPEGKVGVLASPQLLAPADDELVVTTPVELRWAPLADAAGYWLEIAADPDFRRMADSRWGLTETTFASSSLRPGAYYWRAAALDKFGLPGARSPARRLRVQTEESPPFLTIDRPAQEAILRTAPVLVAGAAEPDTMLTHNGRPVEVGPDGRFGIAYQPTRGANEVVIEATDPAGHVTRRARRFVFMPDQDAVIRFDPALPRLAPSHFLTGSDALSLVGATTPAAELVVHTATDRVATTHADAEGRFRINVPIDGPTEAFRLDVIAPSGFVTEDQITITVDRDPPIITLEAAPPGLTAVEWLPLRGRLDEAAALTLNGKALQIVDGMFDEIVALVPGRNRIELTATDLVGNVEVASWEVGLDQEPPTLVSHRLIRELEGSADRAYRIEVVAEDGSGMTEAARFTLQVGNRTESGFLEFNQANGSYAGKVVLGGPGASEARLKDVELEDYAGNRRRYSFD